MLLDIIIVELKKIFSRKLIYILWLVIILNLMVNIRSNMIDYQVTVTNYIDYSYKYEEVESNLKQYKSELKNDSIKNKGGLERLIKTNEEQLKYGKVLVDNFQEPKKRLEARVKLLELDLYLKRSGNLQNPKTFSDYEREINRLNYLIKNNITDEFGQKNGFKYILGSLTSSLIYILIILVLSSSIVSNEYNESTFKLLLTQPLSRGKIVFGKYCTVIISILIIVTLTEIGAFSIVGVWKGFGQANYPHGYGAKYIFDSGIFEYIAGSEKYIGAASYLIKALGIQTLFLISIASFGFLCSTLFKSSVLAMGIGVISNITLLYLTRTELLRKVSHLIYITYNNSYELLSGKYVRIIQNNSVNLFTGILVLIVTSIICYLISHLYFVKKDIL